MTFIRRFICSVLLLCVLTMMCGCKRITESSVDELTMGSWYAENPSGISASLEFIDDEAVFRIYEKGDRVTEISGAFAADKDSLFITSDAYCRTFSFGYKVFGDRCEITYGGECLVFYPESVATSDEILG